jgi:hypothetical protein
MENQPMSVRTIVVILLAMMAAIGIYHLATAPTAPPVESPVPAAQTSPVSLPPPAPSSTPSPAERTPMDEVAEDAKRTIEEINRQQEQEMMAKPPETEMQMNKAD